MNSSAKHQLVTLKRAVRRDGMVCRLRAENGMVRIDIYWKPPRYKRNLAPFIGAMPLALIMELGRAGFASLGVEDLPIDDLSSTGILWASLLSNEAYAEQLARSALASYGLANSDRAVAWAPYSRKAGSPAARHSSSASSEAAFLPHSASLLPVDDAPARRALATARPVEARSAR
jgi:hypothetical protein